MPFLNAPTTASPTEVDVDLHKCVVGNLPLWRSAWTPVFEFLNTATTASSDADAPDTSDLMISLMDVQLALQRCNIDPTKEAMIIDTFESGGKLKAKIDVADSMVDAGAVPVQSLLSSALQDFKKKNWHDFGSQLGKAVQQAVVVSFPQEYEVDDTGKLRKIVIEATELGQASIIGKKSTAVAALFGLVAIMLSALALLVTVRSRTSVLAVMRTSTEDYDLEAVE